MKVNTIKNYTPTFKSSVLPYPEYAKGYSVSQQNAQKTDALASDPVTALVNKFAKAYRLLFTPEITNSANNIKKGIDIVFDDKQVGQKLNEVA
ncbi:MAG: hypothetical protein PHV37_02830 [Candidatus Gastranaerophilales bacterium]|nr:hypothetical protein [Candidatus Gastranaerophilales bacterium]